MCCVACSVLHAAVWLVLTLSFVVHLLTLAEHACPETPSLSLHFSLPSTLILYILLKSSLFVSNITGFALSVFLCEYELLIGTADRPTRFSATVSCSYGMSPPVLYLPSYAIQQLVGIGVVDLITVLCHG